MTISYNPSIVTQNLALLVDTVNPKSYTNGENLWLWSEDPSQASLVNAGLNTFFVNTSTVVTPVGNTASTFIVNNTTSSDYNYLAESYNIGPNGYYTMSIYMYPGTTSTVTMILGTNGFNRFYSSATVWTTIFVNPSTGVMTPSLNLSNSSTNVNTLADFTWGQTPAANGWTRYWMTANLTTTTGAIANIQGGIYIGQAGQTSKAYGLGVYTWGWQLENGTTATTYFPTTASPRYRSLIWNDISGNKNNLTIGGSIYNPGQSMSSGVFFTNSATVCSASASQNFLKTTSATNVSYSFTINANWYADQYYQTLFGMQSSGFTYVATLILDNAVSPIGDLCVDMRSPLGNDRDIIQYNMLPYSNQWILLTYTFNTGTHSLYVNNNLVAQASGNNKIFPGWPSGVSNSGFAIGTNLDSARPIGNANIGWVAVYNSTLTLDQITQNFSALRGRYGI